MQAFLGPAYFYTEGEVDTTITGQVLMWEDAGDILRAVSAAKPLPVNVVASSVGGGDGAILDGVSSSIKATVLDYANSNPLAVRLTDTSGDYVSAGAGTQYTEDVASAADPVGSQLIARRRDSLAVETTTDGDNTALNSTGKGELYVKQTDAVPVTDNGGSLTVDGTVAVTGVATETTLASLLTSAQLIDDIVYTDDTSTHSTGASKGALMMAAATPTDSAVNANDIGAVAMTVDRKLHVAVMDALPAGSAAIGKLAANSGVDIGDVDVTSIVPGTAATNLGKAEDAGHSTGDVGIMALAVRQAADSPLSGSDLDYEPLQTDANGHLKVNVKEAIISSGTITTVTTLSGTTTLTPGTGASNLGKAEDAQHTTGDVGVMMLAVRESTATDLSAGATNGDYEPLQVDANGRLWGVVNIDQMNGVAVTMNNGAAGTGVQRVTIASDSTGNIATIGTSVTPGTAAANLGKAEDAVHNSGDTGVFMLAVANEANTARCADGDYSAVAVDTEGNTRIVGNRDHDAVDAGEPVKVGHKAFSLGSDPAAVAGNDRTDWYALRCGIPFMLGGHPNIIHRQFNITDADGAQTDLNILNAAVAATDRCIVTMLQVTADNANSQDVGVRIGFGAANTPGNDATKVILSHPGLAKGSGIILGNGGGMVGLGADGEELRMTCEDPVGGSLDVVVTYFIISNA